MKTLARSPQGGQYRPPNMRRAGDDGDGRGFRQRHVMADGADIGQHLEFESALAKGLHAHAGRALGGVAENDGDGVALAQIAAVQARGQRLEPGPLMAGVVVAERDARAGAGVGGDIIGGRRIVGLQHAVVADETEHYADAAGVVDAVAPDRVDQAKGLQTAGLESAAGG